MGAGPALNTLVRKFKIAFKCNCLSVDRMSKRYLFALLISISCLSQNKQILYNFTSVPQSLMINPGADVSYKFYFGVPLVSGISVSAGSSSFSAYDLFANNGVDFNTKLRDVVDRSRERILGYK
jgi:hypothetical protein